MCNHAWRAYQVRRIMDEMWVLSMSEEDDFDYDNLILTSVRPEEDEQ